MSLYLSVVAIALLLFCSAARGATYYVSSSGGNDSYTPAQARNQATPWQTLAKVSAQTFAPGDTILFERGDVWEGTLTVSSSGASGNPIVYGAYGSGNRPEIRGTVTIASAWNNVGGVYQTDVPQYVTQVFLDGRPLTLARHPNRGYLTIDSTLSPNTFRCTALGSQDWTGTMVHVRTAHWTIASKLATACNTSQKTITLAATPTYGLKPGWGFFVNGHFAALDTAGEWYCDSAARRLYVRTPDGGSPAGRTVEGSIHPYGVTLNGRSWIVVAELTVRGQTMYGIHCNNSSNITIRGCAVSHADQIGIYFSGSGQNNAVRHCLIEGANRYGILNYGASLVVESDTIRNIALMRNLTRKGLGDECCSGLGIELHGDNAQVRGCLLDSIGYIGIRANDQNNLIEYNVIRRCCLTKDDGAGIYTGWQSEPTAPGAAGTVIRRNIVLETRSAPEGTPDADYTPGEGIYVDDRGHDITIIENTVAGNANHGIFLHNNRTIRVAGNVSYNNRVQMGLAEDAIVGPGYMGNNTVAGNVFYSLTHFQRCMVTSSPYTSTYLARSDSNYYCNPYSDIVLFYNSSAYTLESWQSAKGLDAHSKKSLVSFSPYRIEDITGPNLIANGTFRTGISQWYFWPSAVRLSWEIDGGLDSGCMRVLYTNDSAAAACLVYPASFRLTAGQAYLLSFAVKSNKSGTVTVIARQAHAPWSELGLNTSFAVGTTRKECAVVFVATASDSQARVDFSNTKADSLYWLDNVSLLPVAVSDEDPTQKSRLFYNASMQHQTISLGGVGYRDMDGNTVSGSMPLEPFMSRVLVVDTTAAPAGRTMRGAAGAVVRPVIQTIGRTCRISFALPEAQEATVAVHDLGGRRVAVLVNRRLEKGTHSVVWDRRPAFASGIRLVQVRTAQSVAAGIVADIR